MAEVFRRRMTQRQAAPAYVFHGATAVLAAWLAFKALGA
jgi:hypothetical protein